jgi:hypothetical protein
MAPTFHIAAQLVGAHGVRRGAQVLKQSAAVVQARLCALLGKISMCLHAYLQHLCNSRTCATFVSGTVRGLCSGARCSLLRLAFERMLAASSGSLAISALPRTRSSAASFKPYAASGCCGGGAGSAMILKPGVQIRSGVAGPRAALLQSSSC